MVAKKDFEGKHNDVDTKNLYVRSLNPSVEQQALTSDTNRS